MMAAYGAVSILIFVAINAVRNTLGQNITKCPSLISNPSCPCFNFEDGIFLECPAATPTSLRSVLDVVSGPIQSLSIYDLDRSVTTLKADLFPISADIKHLQISQSQLGQLDDTALAPLQSDLESLSIVSAQLTELPQKPLSILSRLTALDLESNRITELLSYVFYGLRLARLNLKANRIQKISEYTFAGLEDFLSELDLSENKLQTFPMAAIRRLQRLRLLRLAWNEISSIHNNEHSQLGALLFLDLSSNNFEKLPEHCFRPFIALRTLSLYYNAINYVHSDAFVDLTELESLDLSHNKIIFIDASTFRQNKLLKSIDLSHNHVHNIGGVFANLPHLRELFLTENNVLDVPWDAFVHSTNITVIYLQQNAIRRLDPEAFFTLPSLTQLHLSSNFIPEIPKYVFSHNTNLSSLSLDSNRIVHLDVGTFTNTTSLREIRLHNNQLQAISRGVFDPLPSLLELHLQNNELAHIDSGAFHTLYSLQHINLQGNTLTTLGDVFMHDSTSLVSIQLDSNNIGLLHNDSLRGQSSVQIMWLSHNRLQQLDTIIFRDLLLIQRIYLTNNSISIIQDGAFEPMQVLKFLDISYNRLRTINERTLSDLHELEELNLAHNAIQTLHANAFTNLKKLRTIDLSFNVHLKVLDETLFHAGLPIRTLNLMNCSLTNISSNTFHNLTNLNELNLCNNQLKASELPKLHVPGLRVLRLSGNDLTSIPTNAFSGLPSLQVLQLDRCHIISLPSSAFSKTKNLLQIDLSSNALQTLDHDTFTALNVLKVLNLANNKFIHPPYTALLNITTMESLSLSHNSLTTVEVSRLNGLPNLRQLSLDYNSISSLSGFANSNLSYLSSINLSRNLLSALPANFFQHSGRTLRRVDLSQNRFHQIPNAALSETTLPAISWLNMSHNPLLRLLEQPSRHYPTLEELHLSSTNLTIITSQDFENFPALLHVYLRSNQIARLSPGAFAALTNLLTLDLAHNELDLLPPERLQGLLHLRQLNVSHNQLKELQQFSADLHALQILDLSFNQLSRISKATFVHLDSLSELYLLGNWISHVAPDAFKPLKKLRTLDISRNYLENLPLNALRPLETQIRSLRTEDNPLTCTCESLELWEWLRDHQKLVESQDRLQLKCEHPAELRGRMFMKLEPSQFCDQPLVVKIAIQDIQPFSLLVSWQIRPHSGLEGFQVAYYALEAADEIRGKMLDKDSRSLKLYHLQPDTRYSVCVLALGNWLPLTKSLSQLPARWNSTVPQMRHIDFNAVESNDPSDNDDYAELVDDYILPLLGNSGWTKCTEISTLASMSPDTHLHIGYGSSLPVEHGLQSILTRRLGLIIGCCMGFVVFIILISTLGYLKVKKQRVVVKRDDQPQESTEYISYRHFSIQSGGAAGATGGVSISNPETALRSPIATTNAHPHYICTNTPTNSSLS